MPANLENAAVAIGLEKVFSFQPLRQAMPKNVEATAQLHSFHMLAKHCSKFFKPGCGSSTSKKHIMLCLTFQSCPTLCDPVDRSPPGFSVHGDSLGKNTGVCCHALLQVIFPTQE